MLIFGSETPGLMCKGHFCEWVLHREMKGKERCCAFTLFMRAVCVNGICKLTAYILSTC